MVGTFMSGSYLLIVCLISMFLNEIQRRDHEISGQPISVVPYGGVIGDFILLEDMTYNVIRYIS
jgi:uncharacterized protein (UPF0262 family)